MAMKRQKGLGKGIDAFFSDRKDIDLENIVSEEKNSLLDVNLLIAGKYQPRKKINDDSLRELSNSIKEQGIIQPLLVRPIDTKTKETNYEIVAGERRFRAAKLAGLKEIPVLIRRLDDKSAAAISLIENIQRDDLNPIEESMGIKRLVEEFQYTHDTAAKVLGKSRSSITNALRLLKLAIPVQEMLVNSLIDMGHARVLITLEYSKQILISKKIVEKNLSVREVEKLIIPKKEIILNKKTKNRDLARLEEELSDIFATSVKIKSSKKLKGEISFSFSNLNHLQGLIEKFKKL